MTTIGYVDNSDGNYCKNKIENGGGTYMDILLGLVQLQQFYYPNNTRTSV